jgi:hypothetical protein
LWLTPTPLNITCLVNSFPYKFKENFPLFQGDITDKVEDHICEFSNACTILGVNENGSCMFLFKKYLHGNALSLFSNLPNEFISIWSKLFCWFTFAFGNLDIPYEHLKKFNQSHMKEIESILSFNLRFIKLYNVIPMSIFPTNLTTLFHYYDLLPPLYRWQLEEKKFQDLDLSLITFLDFKEKFCRKGFSFGGYDSQKD